MKLIVLALPLFSATKLKCKPKYGLSELSNQLRENNFCVEDAGRTCCSARDAHRINQQNEQLKQTAADLSADCLKMLARVQCSYCDPDFVSEKNKAYVD